MFSRTYLVIIGDRTRCDEETTENQEEQKNDGATGLNAGLIWSHGGEHGKLLVHHNGKGKQDGNEDEIIRGCGSQANHEIANRRKD